MRVLIIGHELDRLELDTFEVFTRPDGYPNGDAATAHITDVLPAILIIALENGTIPDWLSIVRSSPSTRRIPMIALVRDEAGVRSAAALHAAATLSVDDHLIDTLPAAIRQHARVYDQDQALAAQCGDSPPALVLRGLHEFNTGEYFECHETLEEAWNAESGPVRDVYRAILQIGVAYLQITRGNFRGAEKMFQRAAQWFAPLPDRCQGIDIAGLRADYAAARTHMHTLGESRIAEFDRTYLKPIRYE
jgi:uncharacterized protein